MTTAAGPRWARACEDYRSAWQRAPHKGKPRLPSPNLAPSPKVPRSILAKIYASRLGDGDFADYHERWNHEDAQLHCRCGVRKAPWHFIFRQLAPAKHKLK